MVHQAIRHSDFCVTYEGQRVLRELLDGRQVPRPRPLLLPRKRNGTFPAFRQTIPVLQIVRSILPE